MQYDRMATTSAGNELQRGGHVCRAPMLDCQSAANSLEARPYCVLPPDVWTWIRPAMDRSTWDKYFSPSRTKING